MSRSWTTVVVALVATVVAGVLAERGTGTCVNDILYEFEPISALATNITDAKIRPDLCPEKPMYGTVPARAVTGVPFIADPEVFDRDSDSYERMTIIRQEVETPYMVNVDSLTDQEIMSSCLTVADCRMPPALGIIRHEDGDAVWQPEVDLTSKKYKDMFGYWCCDVNEPMAGFPYALRNTNHAAIVRSFPAMKVQYRANVEYRNHTFYPRTALSAAEAKIIRVDFTVGKNTNLYVYVDNTCNDLKGQRWLNGFMGNAARSGSGLFHEVIFKSKDGNLPSAHCPANQDEGPIPLNTTVFTIQFLGNLQENKKTLQWAAARNFWYYAPYQNKDQEGYQRMASVHLKTAMEWLLLAPPKGNLPVALLYTFASKMFLDEAYKTWSNKKKKSDPESTKYDTDKFDFSLIETYQGHQYTPYQTAMEYLIEPNEVTGRARIFHALTELDDFEECKASMLKDFYLQFSYETTSKRKPPESGCLGSSDPLMDCPRWHSRRCKNTFDVLYAARATMWKSFHESIPQCTSCPGLIGWWRSGVTMNPNAKLQAVARYPQCLPWRDSDGTLQDTLGYDMYTSDVYELDYDEGFTCDTSTCRFTDVLHVPLEQLVEVVEGQACADGKVFVTSDNKKKSSGKKKTLDLCRQWCYDIENLKCTTFSYNPRTNLCKLYESCSVLTTKGASADDVMYMAKPKVSDPSRGWADPAEFTRLDDTPAPTDPPTPEPTSAPTKTPTKAPTGPTASPTRAPTSAPTHAPTVAPSYASPITCATNNARYSRGRRLGAFNQVQNLQACINRCRAQDGCEGYTWRSSNKKCWLYTGNYKMKEKSSYTTYTSGPLICPLDSGCEQQFLEIRGKNLDKVDQVESAEVCARICNGRSQCKAWFYRKDRERCILRSSATGQRKKLAYFTSGLQSACAAYGKLAST